MAGLTQGFNTSELQKLKDQIEEAFNALANKTSILEGIEEVVYQTWKGPDSDKFLDALFKEYNETLVPEVEEAYKAMNDEIDRIKNSWVAFQESN